MLGVRCMLYAEGLANLLLDELINLYAACGDEFNWIQFVVRVVMGGSACEFNSGTWQGASSIRSGFTKDEFVVEVDNEILDLSWDVDNWEEVRSWRVNSSRGHISWVLATGNISSDKMASVSI